MVHTTSLFGSSNSFQRFLRETSDIAFTSGLNAMQAADIPMEEVVKTRPKACAFLQACNHGYALAQSQAGYAVLVLEERIRELELAVTEKRKTRTPRIAFTKRRIAMLRRRQHILRRMVDSIVYAKLGRQPWMIKRLLIANEINRIDPTTLRRSLVLAHELNKQDPLVLFIISDLTTCVQLGDLVQFVDVPLGVGKWNLIEVKEGKLNHILLSEVRDGRAESDCPPRPPKVAKQKQRIERQFERMKNVDSIFRTDSGRDFLTGKTITMTEPPADVTDYYEALGRMIARAAEGRIGAEVVDGCLGVVAMKRKVMERAFGTHQHTLYHFWHVERECAFAKAEGDSEIEVRAMQNIQPANMAEISLNTPWSLPVFLWPIPTESMMELLMRRTVVLGHFDYDRWFSIVQQQSFKVQWLKKHKPAEYDYLPGSRAWGIRLEMPDGTVQDVLAGLFTRVFCYLTSPSALLELIKVMPKTGNS